MHIATILAGFTRDDIEVVRSPGHISEETRAAVYALPTSDRCFYCSVPFAPRTRTVPTPKGTVPGAWRTLDHLVPRSRGGSGEADNLVTACTWCNKLKGDTDLESFLSHDQLAARRCAVAKLHYATAA